MATLPDDWSYTLVHKFLEAAVSCGAVCGRRFVSPVLQVEGPPPDCPCQLVATVTEGFEPDGTKCGARRTATLRLVLDLCAPAAGQNEVPDPVRWQTAAREQAATRFAMMRGLHRALRAGEFCGQADDGWPAGTQVGCCDNVTPAPWRATRTEWGSTRYETSWVWHE